MSDTAACRHCRLRLPVNMLTRGPVAWTSTPVCQPCSDRLLVQWETRESRFANPPRVRLELAPGADVSPVTAAEYQAITAAHPFDLLRGRALANYLRRELRGCIVARSERRASRRRPAR
jgi:hypothetical protein